jgi:hypothetical protein
VCCCQNITVARTVSFFKPAGNAADTFSLATSNFLPCQTRLLVSTEDTSGGGHRIFPDRIKIPRVLFINQALRLVHFHPLLH